MREKYGYSEIHTWDQVARKIADIHYQSRMPTAIIYQYSLIDGV